MTNHEWESRMNELRDSQLVTQHMLEALAERHDKGIEELRDAQIVTQRLIGVNEKKWEARFEGLFSVMERHEDQLAELRSRHENDIAELRAMIASLVANIDRFIQGRETNGH